MLYSSLIVAASALAGFATAQNTSTPIACCTIPATSIPSGDRDTLCNANQNTCVELCGGLGDIASNGNQCDPDTLVNSCKCSNGTDITSSLSDYQQSVAGLICQNYWFDACIAASGSNAAQQRSCVTTRESECGNLTTDGTSSGGSSGGSSSSASPSATASRTSGGSQSATGSPSASGAATSSTAPASAANLATYGTPALAGGLLALFGFML